MAQPGFQGMLALMPPSAVVFQFDEHVSPAIAEGLRRRDIVVFTAHELGLIGIPDRQVLSIAHQESRVVVTHDMDYLRLNAEGVAHSGIVFSPQKVRSVGEMIEGLALIHDVYSPNDMMGRLEYI